MIENSINLLVDDVAFVHVMFKDVQQRFRNMRDGFRITRELGECTVTSVVEWHLDVLEAKLGAQFLKWYSWTIYIYIYIYMSCLNWMGAWGCIVWMFSNAWPSADSSADSSADCTWICTWILICTWICTWTGTWTLDFETEINQILVILIWQSNKSQWVWSLNQTKSMWSWYRKPSNPNDFQMEILY